jgi:hypothetical protein
LALADGCGFLRSASKQLINMTFFMRQFEIGCLDL